MLHRVLQNVLILNRIQTSEPKANVFLSLSFLMKTSALLTCLPFYFILFLFWVRTKAGNHSLNIHLPHWKQNSQLLHVFIFDACHSKYPPNQRKLKFNTFILHFSICLSIYFMNKSQHLHPQHDISAMEAKSQFSGECLFIYLFLDLCCTMSCFLLCAISHPNSWLIRLGCHKTVKHSTVVSRITLVHNST